MKLKINWSIAIIDNETLDHITNSEFYYLDNFILSGGIISNFDDEILFCEKSNYEILCQNIYVFTFDKFLFLSDRKIYYANIECYVIDNDFNVTDDTKYLLYINHKTTLNMQELSDESTKEPIESSYYKQIRYNGTYNKQLIYLRFTVIDK
ncbi:hypothetical protein QJ850_gp396 [Acanthamoeba polyphaga mimivirus]|uniref:Uncharacterized protein n=1 Tax=Acanthamoeba polyphaga mimivirus Kroon TaxID=3069720 RepID=A0A0G2Y3E7_9VIRU|nr:hypothetical protein QJ850_gp396 [Acanthamoeba polyphaga mimivirus]AKI80303.1 hypothetical protein [Acanthamoeba polyphaga mimivirus Kroon]